MTEWLHFHFSLSSTGEGNGNPLQCSCLENPRDGGAWWLPYMGSHRVGNDWSDLAAAATFHCVYMDLSITFCLPIHVNGHLGCFYIFAMVNNAAVNIRQHISLWELEFSSFGCISRSGIAGSWGSSIFNFLRKLHSVLIVAIASFCGNLVK